MSTMTPAGSPANQPHARPMPDETTDPPAPATSPMDQFRAEAARRRALTVEREVGRPEDWADPDPAAGAVLTRPPVIRAADRCRDGRPRLAFLAHVRRVCARLQDLEPADVSLEDALAYPWHHLDVDAAVEYRQAIYRRYRAQSTRNDYVSVLRRVLVESHKAGLISALRRDEVLEELYTSAPGASTRRRRLSPAEGDALLLACEQLGTPAARARNTAIVGLFRTSGIRIGELVAICLADWDRVGHTILLPVTKNDRPHRVHLHPDLVPYLERWLEIRGQAPGALFSALHGRSTAPLAPFTIRYMLQTRAKHAGVAPFGAHDFRRTFATDLLRTHDPSLVGKLLNHLKLASTMTYDLAGEDEQRAAVGSIGLPHLAQLTPPTQITQQPGADAGTAGSAA